MVGITGLPGKIVSLRHSDAVERIEFALRLWLAHRSLAARKSFSMELPGTVFCTVFPKTTDQGDLLKAYYHKTEILALVARLYQATETPRMQIFETIKNASAHGGDAIVVARRYQAEKLGQTRTITEVIVWDIGQGIKDIWQALEQGRSSTPDPYSTWRGQGKGMDLLVAEKPVKRFAADEIIVESGRNRVFRTHRTGIYCHSALIRNIPGTRVTLRFWARLPGEII